MARAGDLTTAVLDHDGGRAVTVLVPPVPVEAVVYAADGGWHVERLAQALEGADGPSTMVVGVHGLADDDGRLAEYVQGFDPARFSAHERFFVDEVAGWVAERFGLALPAERTGVWGASLGGELALALGLRHPEVFGAAFVASPGAGFRPPDEMPGHLPRTYLVPGRQEPFFLENAVRWADALRAAGAEVAMVERDGEHGGAFWQEELPLMLAWAFAS
jgi:enterochelin esterase-like enzyme